MNADAHYRPVADVVPDVVVRGEVIEQARVGHP